VWRGRLDYPALKAKVEALARQWKASQVLIEEAGTAIGLIQELRYRIPGVTGIKPDRDKVTRMSLASALFEARQVFPSEPDPICQLSLGEACLFPVVPYRRTDRGSRIDPEWPLLVLECAHNLTL